MPQNIKKTVLFMDGAMGTMIQKKKLDWHQMPETLNMTQPEKIKEIHKAYIDAGANVILANTFGLSPLRTSQFGLDAGELIAAGIKNAKEAAGNKALAALDIGPCGMLLEPLGTLAFEEAVDNFAAMVKAGKEAGADLIFIETMSSLAEARAALIAAKEYSDLPVWVSMSFEADGRTFTGTGIEEAVLALDALGADAVGLNCSLGPDLMAGLVEKAAALTDKPIICKPNAGLPDPMTSLYEMDEQAFGDAMKSCLDKGAGIIGGCCGTSPAYIKAIHERFKDYSVVSSQPEIPYVSSERSHVNLNQIQVIGERINPTGKKRLQKALLEKDLDYIQALALEQQKAGANILDVNAGYPGVDEEEMLPEMVKVIQAVCDLPLCLDCTNAAALEKALKIYHGRALINSFHAKEESMSAILPLAKKYGALVIGLCIDEEGIPNSAEKRYEIACRLKQACREYGLKDHSLLVDPLTLTVSASPDQPIETLKAASMIKEQLHVPVVLGVSNISYGLPNREWITQTFLAQALQAGLNVPIINPNTQALMNTIMASRLLMQQDDQAAGYIAWCLGHEAKKEAVKEEMDLKTAIVSGLDKQAYNLAKAMIIPGKEQELIEQELIPALDLAGRKYEEKTLFLPQLLAAAKAAQAVFEAVKTSLAENGSSSSVKKDKILLATVQGDVHDIGKNIVKTILENYGYDVLDLGRDVKPETILAVVKEHNIKLVGLSALMTTTLPAMEETIKALKALDQPPFVMAGGAVVTEEFVKAAGGDFYCADAADDVAAARKVFGHE